LYLSLHSVTSLTKRLEQMHERLHHCPDQPQVLLS